MNVEADYFAKDILQSNYYGNAYTRETVINFVSEETTCLAISYK